VTSHVRRRPSADGLILADVTIVDPDGRVVVEFTGFTMRRIEPEFMSRPRTEPPAAQRGVTLADRRAAAPDLAPPVGPVDPTTGLPYKGAVGIDPDVAIRFLLEILSRDLPRQVVVRPFRNGRPVPIPDALYPPQPVAQPAAVAVPTVISVPAAVAVPTTAPATTVAPVASVAPVATVAPVMTVAPVPTLAPVPVAPVPVAPALTVASVSTVTPVPTTPVPSAEPVPVVAVQPVGSAPTVAPAPEPVAASAANSILDRLRVLWAAALGVEDIAPDADFFDLGGNSLSAIDLMGRIRIEFGADLGITMLFDYPTLGELAAVLLKHQS
jgi:acyl carrier protein